MDFTISISTSDWSKCASDFSTGYFEVIANFLLLNQDKDANSILHL